MNVILTPRLQAVADMVGECDSVADVGTDHAYLPIYLLQNGRCQNCIASDIAQGPLSRAEEYVQKHLPNSDRIKTVLSDGLKNVPLPCDVVTVAGMGGETIVGILSAVDIPIGQRFVFQPMSKAEVLRQYLYENGYEIQSETAVTEDFRTYCIMSAVKSGVAVPFSLGDCYISSAMLKDLNEEKRVYINKVLISVEKKLNGLKQAAVKDEKQISEYEKLFNELKGVCR